MAIEEITPEDAFRRHYIRLRTVLDGLEATALRYCLKDPDPDVRSRRAQELIDMIMPAVKEVEDISTKSMALMGCGEGYCLCNGVCVPYDCPDGGSNS